MDVLLVLVLVLLVVVLVVVGSLEVVVGAAVDEVVVEVEDVVGWVVDVSLLVSAAADDCATVSAALEAIDAAVTAAPFDGEAIFNRNFGQCWSKSVKNR